MSQTVARRLLIQGRVQGVFFRQSTREKAVALGVHGWVRNRRDGRVEVLAWGDPAAVDALIDWCRRGPPMARVTNVTVEEAEPGRRAGFTVRYW